MLDIVYYLMVGSFFTHELDAVKRHEWRVLPVIRALPERFAEQTFIWLHVPIFALLLWGGDGQASNRVRIGLAVFAIVHVGLHWFFRKHPAYEFNNPGSWAMILLPGFAGAVYLILVAAS